MLLLLKICKHRAGTVRNMWLTMTKFTQTKKCRSTATTDAMLNQCCNSEGRQAFQYQRELAQPGVLLKGQLRAIHLQTVMQRRAHLTFSVQPPIPHISIMLLQMKGNTAKIGPTQNSFNLHAFNFIYMRQNEHTSIKTGERYYITNFKLFIWQMLRKIQD